MTWEYFGPTYGVNDYEPQYFEGNAGEETMVMTDILEQYLPSLVDYLAPDNSLTGWWYELALSVNIVPQPPSSTVYQPRSESNNYPALEFRVYDTSGFLTYSQKIRNQRVNLPHVHWVQDALGGVGPYAQLYSVGQNLYSGRAELYGVRVKVFGVRSATVQLRIVPHNIIVGDSFGDNVYSLGCEPAQSFVG